MKMKFFFILSATLFLTVTGNKITAQVIAVDDVPFVNEDEAAIIDVLANDINPSVFPMYIILLSSPPNGSAVVNVDETITYTPNLNYNGIDTFSYLACNTDPLFPSCDDAQVVLSIIPMPDYPVALDDTVNVNTGSETTIYVQANDTNYDAEEVVTSILIAPEHGAASVVNDDSIHFAASATYYGLDSLVYTLCKAGSDIYCDTATVHILINSVNFFHPDCIDDHFTVTIGSSEDLDVLANDSDGDGDILHVAGLLYSETLLHGTVTLSPDGVVTYTGSSDGIDHFSYIACDGNAPEYCDTANVTVTVEDIHIPDSFSPNGDGMNDELVIAGISTYPEFNMKIFNRWGDLVFENTDPYTSWDGSSNQEFMMPSGELPDGTYFYLLDLGSGIEPLKGFIVLRR